MITLEQLKSFCSRDETRLVINEPATRDGFTWATDGRILIRVPLMPDVPVVDGFPNVASVWAAGFKPNADFKPMPPLPEPVPEDLVDCEKCDGLGVTDCPTCHQGMECNECDGDGKIRRFDTRWTRVDGHPFMIGLLQRIAALPNPRLAIAANVNDGHGTGAMGSFIFDGGAGIVRGMKPRDKWEGSRERGRE